MSMDEVKEGLWVGNLLCLRAFTALDEARITHILSVTNDPVRWSDGLMARGIVHKQICLRDVDHEFESQMMLFCFDNSFEFIEGCLGSNNSDPKAGDSNEVVDTSNQHQRNEASALRREPGAVLVHCVMGISRSPTIIAAYLMRKHGITRDEALTRVRHARPHVDPNPGFLRALREYEQKLGLGVPHTPTPPTPALSTSDQ